MRLLEYRILTDDFSDVKNKVGGKMKQNHVSKALRAETMLILEALTYTIAQQNEGQDVRIMISGKKSLGKTTITLCYDGPRYETEKEDEDDFSPEYKILKAYADKIEYSYFNKQNEIKLTVSRSSIRTLVLYLISFLIASTIFLLLTLVNPDSMDYIHKSIVGPVERVFTNTMLMIGTIVTFLSLLKNLTDAYIVSEKNSDGKKIQKMTVVSSIVAILLAVVASFLITRVGASLLPSGNFHHTGSQELGLTLSGFIETLMPSDIFSVFQTFSPFPVLILAGIVTYACCSVGPQFDRVKKGIEVLYGLFCRILNVVMYSLPFFVAIAVLDVLMAGGYTVLLDCVILFLMMTVSLILLAIYYILRLWKGGVKVIPFIRKLLPLIRENFGIASSIDAVPYNIRYCARVYKLERRNLEVSIPVLAQLNLDGNCFLITSLSLVFMFFINVNLNIFTIFTICIIVFGLSLGAPNQPGSCLIGMLIILFYLNCRDMVAIAILGEVVCGSLQNIVNVVGDIVSVVVIEEKQKRLEAVT